MAGLDRETAFSNPTLPIKGNMVGGGGRPRSRRSRQSQFVTPRDGGCLINVRLLKRDGPDIPLNFLYKISHLGGFPHIVIAS